MGMDPASARASPQSNFKFAEPGVSFSRPVRAHADEDAPSK
jgi:hypothetical protein